MALEVRIIEHPAHAPGHAALLIEERGVLVAGDMLSDVLIPMLDDLNSTNDPIEDYLIGLRLLEGVADDVDVLIPGHGSVGGADQVRARIEQDRAYVQALRDGGGPDDPRIGPSAKPGWEWVSDVHAGKPSASPKEANATRRPASDPASNRTRRLLPGLQLPGADHRVFHGICIPVLEVRDHHHVLREALRHREGLGERPEQVVSELERRTDDDVAVVELPRHQAAAIPPIKQALPTTLGDTVQLGSEATEVRERHRVIVAGFGRSEAAARSNTCCEDPPYRFGSALA